MIAGKNTLKVKLKRDTPVGAGGINHLTLPAGSVGFVVDAIPYVKEETLAAQFVILFPVEDHIAVLDADKVDIIQSPDDNDNAQWQLSRLIAQLVSGVFVLQDKGIDWEVIVKEI